MPESPDTLAPEPETPEKTPSRSQGLHVQIQMLCAGHTRADVWIALTQCLAALIGFAAIDRDAADRMAATVSAHVAAHLDANWDFLRDQSAIAPLARETPEALQ